MGGQSLYASFFASRTGSWNHSEPLALTLIPPDPLYSLWLSRSQPKSLATR